MPWEGVTVSEQRAVCRAGKLLYGLLSRYFCQAAGRKILTAMVSSHQSFGAFASWNPHWHTIVLEGGFDRQDHFFFIPIGAGDALCEAWRCTVVAFFLDKGLLNREFARTLLSWRHSGFSIDRGAGDSRDRQRSAAERHFTIEWGYTMAYHFREPRKTRSFFRKRV